jgi:MoaA/NifB/PqqE/SkfB family radical SAM enzyme
MATKGQLFCSKPFTWFEITHLHERGEVYMCCPTWLNVPIGNLQHETVEEVWNGKEAQKIRRSILNGSFRYCNYNRCSFLQTVSGPVKRIEEVDEPDLKEIIQKKITVLPHGPKDIICTYDRSCNLSCPSCRAEVVIEAKNRDEILKIQEKIQNGALKDAEYLHITGSGDPFGSPFFRKWLQTMKKQEMPGVKTIHLHTNALLWTPKMWNSIPEKIQGLITSAEISIDAAKEETYAVNRRGGNFELLLKNMEFISKLRREGSLEYVRVSMVVQENNFREMPEFVRLGRRFSCDLIYFGQLVNWGTFSEEEYRSRAIHLPTHPNHGDFLNLLRDGIFEEPGVYLGNLSALRDAAGKTQAKPGRRGLGWPRYSLTKPAFERRRPAGGTRRRRLHQLRMKVRALLQRLHG